MSDALVIAAHGSRDPAGIAETLALADAWRALRPDRPLVVGFLEFARPTIGAAIDQAIADGARRVIVVPAMLTAAGHVKNDVPSEIQEARARHPGVAFRMARPLGIHPALLELGGLRYGEAIRGRPEVPPERTLLLLVGRGTSDPDANAEIARISRFLGESYRVGWAAVAFSGLAAPDVDEALTRCRRLGFPRIVVQPYFLFDGVLLKRIGEAAAQHAAADRAVEIVTTDHLRPHPLLVQAFEDRAHEAAHGAPPAQCDLCKYRVRLIGREDDLGAPQFGHHHHVRATRGRDGSDPSDGMERKARSPAPGPPDSSFHPWDERLLRRLHLVGEPS